MPNRIIKEKLLYSQDIAQLTDAEEAFFYRLLVNADDHGRFFADPEIVRARCYPRGRVGVTEDVVREHIQRLVDLGMVELYEHEGDQFLVIASWEKHQQKRATHSKFPDPQAPESTRKQVISDDIKPQQLQADVPETTRLREARSETTRIETFDKSAAKPRPEINGKPRSPTETQAFLLHKLVDRDSRWDELWGLLTKLNAEMTRPVVTTALQHLVESDSSAERPPALLVATCKQIREEQEETA